MTTLEQIVRAYQPDIIACCQRLLQTPSVNGVHDEADLAQVIAEQARALGLYVEIVGENPRRPNVIVSTAPEGQTGLLLLGHLDTVPPGDEARWKFPPFSGTVEDGRIYGRGAVDTKGGMTAALYALAALKQVEGSLAGGRAQLICVPDEETGATGTLGIKFLRERGLLHGLGAIYAYSGSDIVLGHRGVIRYRVVCEGQSIHTGANDWQERKSGANAVTAMAYLLVLLELVPSDYSAVKYFESFKTVITPGTVIHGGTSINIVPDYCEALIDVRTTPEIDLETMTALLDESIAATQQDRPGLRFSYMLLNDLPAVISDENAPIFSILEAVVEAVKGHKPQRVVAGPANEGYLLIESGIPTVCGFGPTGENAHALDEYVDIEGLVDAAVIFALTAQQLSQHLK